VGISSPGPVDPHTGVVLEPPNLGADFRNIPLAAQVAAALELPTFLDRDTNVALLGERAFGAARGESDAVYLTVSTGVGGAILSGGTILRGPDGLAGELGHLVVELDGPRCGCGGIGHVEAIASGVALARDARAAAKDGTSPFLAARAAGGAELTGRDVSAGAAQGDATCIALLARTRGAVAAACVSIANTLNPHLIVIGGAIGLALGESLLDEVRAAIRDEVFPVIGRHVRVANPELGDDVSLAGAWPLVHGHAAARSTDHRPSNDRLPSASRRATGSPKEVAIP
jgi:glucokinase